MPAKQFKAVKGGEVMQYPGVNVEATLGHHNVIATTVPEGFLEKQAAALQVASLQEPLTDAEKQQNDAIRARGSRDPKIATDGVINYLFTFGSSFRLLFSEFYKYCMFRLFFLVAPGELKPGTLGIS